MRTVALAGALSVLLAIRPAALAAQSADGGLQQALERAAGAGVPLELLQSKVEEGRAKGVPLDALAAAVAMRADALIRLSERLASAHPSAAELGAAADAAAAGASADQVARIVETARTDRALALVVLAQLVQMGHAPDEALDAVLDGLGRGTLALLKLPAQVAAADARRTQNGPAGTVGGRTGPPPGVQTGGKGGTMMGGSMMGGKQD